MNIKDRLDLINNKIENACALSGRKKSDIRLIAVTKTRSVDEINEALSLGLTDIGENRVRELTEKYDFIEHNPQIHLIGQLQTNKVKYICGKVDYIHSLDRISLAEELERQAQKNNLPPFKVLIEVNIGREESKSGIFSENLTEFLDNLTNFMYIKPMGLMTVAPADANDTEQNRYFDEMHSLLSKGQAVFGNAFCELSMGMSRDFENAIKHGSTMVRLGTALFGERTYKL